MQNPPYDHSNPLLEQLKSNKQQAWRSLLNNKNNLTSSTLQMPEYRKTKRSLKGLITLLRVINLVMKFDNERNIIFL